MGGEGRRRTWRRKAQQGHVARSEYQAFGRAWASALGIRKITPG